MRVLPKPVSASSTTTLAELLARTSSHAIARLSSTSCRSRPTKPLAFLVATRSAGPTGVSGTGLGWARGCGAIAWNPGTDCGAVASRLSRMAITTASRSPSIRI